MRRLPRLPQSLDLFVEPAAVFPRSRTSICLSCRRRRTFTTTASRPAAEKPALTDRLRQKIWGTDKPPGAVDPYSKGSPLRPAPTEVVEEPEGQEASIGAEETRLAANAYEQATTWEGLEWVATKEWEEQRQTPVGEFKGWLGNVKRATAPEYITAALRWALIEVFALRQAGQPLELAWRSHRSIPRNPMMKVKLDADANNDAVLVFPSAEARTALLARLGASVKQAAKTVGGGGTGARVVVSKEEQAEAKGKAVLHYHRRWRHISLQDQEIKFAVIKRVMELTRIRLHDPAIHKSNTAGILFEELCIKPKPTKLVQVLKADNRLPELPNVKVSNRRITPIDKERAVGRWKVIERELLDRGLPVTGHA